MAKPTALEFFEAFYREPLRAGQLALYTTTLRRGKNLTYWCRNLEEADRLCSKYRNTRRVRFGVGLQSSQRAEALARTRRTGVWAGNVRGCAASVTALPAVWVEIPCLRAGAPAAGDQMVPRRPQALNVLAKVTHRPSIVVSTGTTLCAFWLLDDPWIFDLEDPRCAARASATAVLVRLRWTIAERAAEGGWHLPVDADLAASFPVPGTATGDSSRGPRAELETFPLLPGDGRYRRSDFESLPEPPPEVLDPGLSTPPPGAGDFRPVVDGCSWLRRCLAEGPSLEQPELELAIELLSRCSGPVSGGAGSGNRHPVYELCAGHPDVDPWTLARRLAEPASGEPVNCARIGLLPGAFERHCSGCPNHGRIGSPVELALADAARPWRLHPPPNGAPATVLTGGDAAADRARLLAGLEEAFIALGGPATARGITRALAAEPERFPGLAAAFVRLAPGLRPDDPAAAAALGLRLRALKGRELAGRALVAHRRTRDGLAWTVRPAGPDAPPPHAEETPDTSQETPA